MKIKQFPRCKVINNLLNLKFFLVKNRYICTVIKKKYE